MKTVYLCGLMDPNAYGTIEWRALAEEKLISHFDVLSPVRNEALDRDPLCVATSGMQSTYRTGKEIMLQDYNDIVLRADVILANLNRYGSKRPLQGTLFELAWAWDYQIPVVGVYYSEGDRLSEHPFIAEAVVQWATTIEEAANHLLRYYR